MSEGNRPLTCDVPQMDLGNHEPKIFGLNYRQIVMFLIAGIIMWQILSHNWGKDINWYMPWVIIVFTPAVYFSSVKPFGMKPERFLLTWIRYSFLTKPERPYMSSLQNVEKTSTGEAIKGVQDKMFKKKEEVDKNTKNNTVKETSKKAVKKDKPLQVDNKIRPNNSETTKVDVFSGEQIKKTKKTPTKKKPQPHEDMGGNDFFFN